MNCPHCGKPMKEGEWFCPSCGGTVPLAAMAATPSWDDGAGSKKASLPVQTNREGEGAATPADHPGNRPPDQPESQDDDQSIKEPPVAMRAGRLDFRSTYSVPEGKRGGHLPDGSDTEVPVMRTDRNPIRETYQAPDGKGPKMEPVPVQEDPLVRAQEDTSHAKGPIGSSNAVASQLQAVMPKGSHEPTEHRRPPEVAPPSDSALSDQLAARKPYVPEPSVGPSPLAVVAAVAAVVAAVLVLGRAGVVALPSWGVPTEATSSQGAASADSSAGQMDGRASKEDSGQSEGEGDAQQSAGGPDAGTSSGTESVDGYTYQLVHEPLTWSEAEAWCEQQGGQLAQPHTTEEWRAVLDLASESDAYVVWLGGTRQADGSFTWLDGSPVTLREWAAGEPNNQDGNEACLGILRYHGGAALYDLPDDPGATYPSDYLGFVMQTKG